MTADSINYFRNVVSLIPKLWLRSGLEAQGNCFPPRSEQISLSHSKGSDGKSIFSSSCERFVEARLLREIIINVLRRKQRVLAENYAAASIAFAPSQKQIYRWNISQLFLCNAKFEAFRWYRNGTALWWWWWKQSSRENLLCCLRCTASAHYADDFFC